MMTTTTFCSSPDTKKQKRRIEVTRDHPVPLPVALVRGNACHKTGSLFTGSRHHVTNRTSQASGLITGVFTRCRPRTAHHQPTGITHMTLPNRDKRPPDTGAVKAHLRGLLNINVKKGSRHCCLRDSAYIRPAPYTPAAESAAPRSDRADVSPGTHCHRRPPHNQR